MRRERKGDSWGVGMQIRSGRCGHRLLAGILLCACGWREAAAVESLADLSLEALSQVEVTSVSKGAEALNQAPASIYVISHDDILRSGVTSIGEALRLAPNLLISQYSTSNHIAGARGFGGAQEAQNFSNKLLILIDGRSVYSPLYSGVYLDAQDLELDDIERIEVISGPGATLWGANAMNGVINIITRPAYLTTQPLVAVGAGNEETIARLRFGRTVNGGLSYRVYAKAFDRDAMEVADGSSANDDWRKLQAGFRADWTGPSYTLTTTGDVYRGLQRQAFAGPDGLEMADGEIEGGNLMARWHGGEPLSQWQLQMYTDFTQRAAPRGGVGFTLRTHDVEMQHAWKAGMHRLVWGGGLRLHDYDIRNGEALRFEPDHRSFVFGNLFVQDTISLTAALSLTVGLKLERDGYGHWSPLPDLRAGLRVGRTGLLWASATRAVRAPTPFDRDVREILGGQLFLVGNKDFDSEKVDAFEIGYRARPLDVLSLSMAVFFNRYDDLRTIEFDPDTLLPLRWDNRMHGRSYGAEGWANWQVTSWWRLSPGVRVMRKDLAFDEDSSRLLGYAQAGNDPKAHALLTSAMDLGPRLRLNLNLRHVAALPSPRLEADTELGASLQYQLTPRLTASLTGFNLLDDRHLEYPAPSGEYIERSVLVQLTWRP